MKKVLVVGNGDSIFVKDFIDKLSCDDLQIDLLSEGKSTEIKNANKVVVFSNNETNKYKGLLLRLKSIYKFLSQVNTKYDVIVIHFIQFFYTPLIPLFARKSNRLVGVFWGSDYYKSQTKLKKFALTQICDQLHAIAFTNELTLKDFSINFASIDKTKLQVARFGLPALEEIDALILKRENYPEWCEEFGVPVDKIKIMVGYNASLNHKQLEIIDAVTKFDKELKDRIHLVFPLGYGGLETKNLILHSFEKGSEISYTLLEKFYDFKDVARLRMVTDILINIQPSDQFSGSMQETLYAGGWVLTGQWLPYQKILEQDPKIELIKDFNEFSIVLARMIVNEVHNNEINVTAIRDFICANSSWESNIKKWHKILFEENRK